MKTLIINTHPDFKNKEHFSIKLQDMFLEKYKENFEDSDLEIINLYEENIPRLDTNMLSMWTTQATKRAMTDIEKEIETKQNKLLEQFKKCHRIVIVAPTHNFMVTSVMKDYLDNILVPRQTYRYTETGSEGLMTDDYRVMLLVTSGSIYTNNDRYTALELQHFYLKEMFSNVMAFDSFDIVRAQGTAILPAEEVLKSAKEELDTSFEKFYSKK